LNRRSSSRAERGHVLLFVLLIIALAGTYFLSSAARVQRHVRQLETAIARDQLYLKIERNVYAAQRALRHGDHPAGAEQENNLLTVRFQRSASAPLYGRIQGSLEAVFDADQDYALVDLRQTGFLASGGAPPAPPAPALPGLRAAPETDPLSSLVLAAPDPRFVGWVGYVLAALGLAALFLTGAVWWWDYRMARRLPFG
jgi:hypothetical protein